MRLGLAVQDVADQVAGVEPVGRLGDGAERAGQVQPPGDDRGQLDRRRGHQPDPLAGVEVLLGQGERARPDPVGHLLVVDLLAERDDLGDVLAGDERERGLAGAVQVAVRLAAQPQPHLREREPGQVVPGEEVARGQALGEVEDRRADHHRVVDVEEGRGLRIGRDRRADSAPSPAGCAASPGQGIGRRPAGASSELHELDAQPCTAAG